MREEFRCSKCLKYKGIELYSFSYKGTQKDKRHVCKPCGKAIQAAYEARTQVEH